MWAVVGPASYGVALNYALGPQTGFGLALIAQIVLFVARSIWKKTQNRTASAAA